ncbi:MAG: DUF3347 domain-containing protein, partial [Planctomycetaceae bacterium]|nr:DUF3347 domain-containing protein [Planctomycetaceae bacterium]
ICGMKLVPTSRYGYADRPVSQPVSLTVPRSALLMAGEHSVVYAETEPGRFELRQVTLGPILKDYAIVLNGLKSTEHVATSGNFLIDSQMQLAGKPSLIDPTRFVPTFRNKPLEFESIKIAQIEGETGHKLEELYKAYFAIQKRLTEDKLPTEPMVATLSQLSGELLEEESLEEAPREQLKKISENVAHLHHLSLEDARKKFKPISHAVVTLATEVRGQEAERAFHHFFCPMVKQGEGDWLQLEDQLSNPYYGSQMLRCGELVRDLPPKVEGGGMKDE